MARHNTMKFTTKDKDHDTWVHNCAISFTGAWWYKDCHSINLNGKNFNSDDAPEAKGITLKDWRSNTQSLSAVRMSVKA